MIKLNIPCPFCDEVIAEIGGIHSFGGQIGVALKLPDLGALLSSYTAHVVTDHTKGFADHVKEAVPDDLPDEMKDVLDALFRSMHPGHNHD